MTGYKHHSYTQPCLRTPADTPQGSEFFRALLSERWREGQALRKGGQPSITISPLTSLAAVGTILRILHQQQDRDAVDRGPADELVRDLAVEADYLGAVPAVRGWGTYWLGAPNASGNVGWRNVLVAAFVLGDWDFEKRVAAAVADLTPRWATDWDSEPDKMTMDRVPDGLFCEFLAVFAINESSQVEAGGANKGASKVHIASELPRALDDIHREVENLVNRLERGRSVHTTGTYECRKCYKRPVGGGKPTNNKCACGSRGFDMVKCRAETRVAEAIKAMRAVGLWPMSQLLSTASPATALERMGHLVELLEREHGCFRGATCELPAEARMARGWVEHVVQHVRGCSLLEAGKPREHVFRAGR